MDYTLLLADIEDYVRQFISNHDKPELLYHNLHHTVRVVNAAKQIAAHYKLEYPDLFIVTAAAWFHDIGYYVGDKDDHEIHGVKVATEYLQKKGVEPMVINKVEGCILATKIPQRASNLLEEIVCDADLFHLGTSDFEYYNKLMKKEAEAMIQHDIPKENWRAGTIHLLQLQQYYTDYCRTILGPKKEENLTLELEKQQPKKLKAQKKDTSNKKDPGRGIETMFRTTSANNQRLSDMADNKSQILITVNSIILSVILSVLLRKLDDNEHLIIPTFMILAVCVSTMVIGILATRPSLPHGTFTEDDVEQKRVNLLFFGNFYKMSLEKYAAGMEKVMSDRDFLYGTLVKDVYAQGVVLGKKYKLLRLAYNIFMFGIIASVVAFVIASIIAR